MSDTSKLSTCQIVCWGLSALAGLAVLWSASGAVGFLAALLLARAFACNPQGVVLASMFSERSLAGNLAQAAAAPDPAAVSLYRKITG